MREATLLLPAEIGDYTDFYASVFHAGNVGSMFRPDNPLLPNYKWVPIGYHGRASSVIVSGTPVCRPKGQARPQGADRPTFGPSKQIDYELEIGAWIAGENRLAEPVSPQAAEAHFLLGSAHILLAEQAAVESASDLWLRARLHLEQAETIGLSPRDQLRHHYRLAKTYFHLNLVPQRIIDYLADSVGADNSFEAYGLLARAYLRLDPPNLAKALEALLAPPGDRCGPEVVEPIDVADPVLAEEVGPRAEHCPRPSRPAAGLSA